MLSVKKRFFSQALYVNVINRSVRIIAVVMIILVLMITRTSIKVPL
jgi:hypothetical protein